MIVYKHETSFTHPSEDDMAEEWKKGYQLLNICHNCDTKEYHTVYFYTGGRRRFGSSTNNG